MPTIKVFTAEHHNPWFNLATEDWLFKTFPIDQHVLFLWRNSPCIVIGRFQNPWVECNLKAMEADDVLLARRQSGGGAVYHDLGNTNFTFMSPRHAYDKNLNFHLIIDALKRFGVTAEQSGRNDILVEGKKVSGSAFRMATKKAFHHGTLLINASMEKLPHYLTPDSQKLNSKGVRSVASRVANLSSFNSDITHDSLSAALIESFFDHYQMRCEIEDLTIERLSQEKSLYETYRHYSDWQWRFGSTPEFDHPLEKRFAWGKITLDFVVNEGLIQSVLLFSDALSVELLELIQNSLHSVPYNSSEIARALLQGASTHDTEVQQMVQDVVTFIKEELE
ncbi:MAG: lipoate--protein ligase [Sphaerochaetaceae bacterium]